MPVIFEGKLINCHVNWKTQAIIRSKRNSRNPYSNLIIVALSKSSTTVSNYNRCCQCQLFTSSIRRLVSQDCQESVSVELVTLIPNAAYADKINKWFWRETGPTKCISIFYIVLCLLFADHFPV